MTKKPSRFLKKVAKKIVKKFPSLALLINQYSDNSIGLVDRYKNSQGINFKVYPHYLDFIRGKTQFVSTESIQSTEVILLVHLIITSVQFCQFIFLGSIQWITQLRDITTLQVTIDTQFFFLLFPSHQLPQINTFRLPTSSAMRSLLISEPIPA